VQYPAHALPFVKERSASGVPASPLYSHGRISLEKNRGEGNGEDEGVVAGEHRRGLVMVGVPGLMGVSTPKYE
jgi:hypothetical protein